MLDNIACILAHACMETKEYITLRVWKQTRRKLKLISAHKDETIIETLDRLADEELRRIKATSEDSKGEKPEQD